MADLDGFQTGSSSNGSAQQVLKTPLKRYVPARLAIQQAKFRGGGQQLFM
ncbi:hypothetical protein [Fibrella arboris]